MSKKKHILDWYIDNTPDDDEEYDKGCLVAFAIIAIIFLVLVAGLLICTNL